MTSATLEAPQSMTPALTVSGLHCEYSTPVGPVHAVRGVSFSLAKGERLGIVGESGCGKSALALGIMGLLEAPGRIVSGSVFLDNHDLVQMTDGELRRVHGNRVALIFQDPHTSLNPIKTIGAQMIEAIRQHQDVSTRQARAQALTLLSEVGVRSAEQRFSAYPHEFSGGMQQRVMIAMAVCNTPDVIIADEPTTALDVTTQAQVLKILDRLARDRGSSIILITHNLGLVAQFCDRIAVMYAGRIVESADCRELFAAQAHPYSRALLQSLIGPATRALRRLPTIGGAPPELFGGFQGCSFEPRCPLGHGRDLCVRSPEPVTRQIRGGRDRLVECHFGEQQIAESSRLTEDNG